jgi:RHS repeat-associated protein
VIGWLRPDGRLGGAYTYDAYGNSPQAGAAGPLFRYAGMRYDPEIALYHTPNRAYDPVDGRWMQLDPIGIEDGLNRYAYVRNSPLMGVDPTGLECIPQDDGSTECDPPGDEIGKFTIPPTITSPGYIGPKESGHHVYNAETSTPGSSQELTASIESAVINNPTPGSDLPATPEGVVNDAGISPFSGDFGDKVVSFVSKDSNGNTIVVNVTIPGQHALNPGYVAQAIVPQQSSTSIFVVGEGNALVQVGPGSAAGGAVFQSKIEGDMRKGVWDAVRKGKW